MTGEGPPPANWTPSTTSQAPSVPKVPNATGEEGPPPDWKPSASGDPHLTNIHGQTFDINKVGQMEFLRVPLESAITKANLTLLATIEDVLGAQDKCEQSLYITSLQFGGAWLGDRKLEVSMHKGEMAVSFDGERVKPSDKALPLGSMLHLDFPNEDQFHVSLGQTSIDVARDRRPVHFFLNVQATSLAQLQCRIGGLLGEGDHTDVSMPKPGCHESQRSLIATRESGSVAYGSL